MRQTVRFAPTWPNRSGCNAFVFRQSLAPRRDQLRGDRARKKKVAGIVGIAHAHMAIRIHHVLARQDAVGDDEIPNERIDRTHA